MSQVFKQTLQLDRNLVGPKNTDNHSPFLGKKVYKNKTITKDFAIIQRNRSSREQGVIVTPRNIKDDKKSIIPTIYIPKLPISKNEVQTSLLSPAKHNYYEKTDKKIEDLHRKLDLDISEILVPFAAEFPSPQHFQPDQKVHGGQSSLMLIRKANIEKAKVNRS